MDMIEHTERASQSGRPGGRSRSMPRPMRGLAFLLATLAGPALSASIEIEVEGEANGKIAIDLLEDVAPGHVERIVALAEEGAYDGVAFHRVIEGFMAQTGDVEFGRVVDGNLGQAGTGGSNMPNLKAEFTDMSFERGVVGMARSGHPDSANSQFFIMFAPAPHLDGQYTVVGRVTEGFDVLDKIKRGQGPNGAVLGNPDVMNKVTVVEGYSGKPFHRRALSFIGTTWRNLFGG